MKNFRGYTLIELLVAIGIFSIVMLGATSAYISFINYNRQAQTRATEINSLFFAIDSMARDIRTGSGYTCPSGACLSTGVTKITFTDQDGCSVYYKLKTVNSVPSIVRNVTGSVSPVCAALADTPITDPAITVQSLLFYVRGVTSGDKIQPIVTIVVSGSACVPNTDCTGAGNIPFQVQTSATQRIPDL